MSDAALNVSGPRGGERTPRAAAVAEALEDVFSRAQSLTAQALGTGGRVLLPCVADGKVRFQAVGQDRFFVTATRGGQITAATVLAGRAEVDGHTYYRWTAYALENGVQTISTRVDGRLRPCRAAGDGAAVGGACRGGGHCRRRAPDACLSALARRRPARGRRLRRAHHLRLRGR